jgi:hypothetical protein
MAVEDVSPLFAGKHRNTSAQFWAKPFLTTKGGDWYAHLGKFQGPGAGLIKAADRHTVMRMELLRELDHESLGSPGSQTQDDLQDTRSHTASGGETGRQPVAVGGT